MAESILLDIGIVLTAVTITSILGSRMGQPNVLSYLIAGILIGPSVLGLIENQVFLEGLSELGIAFLLFLVGLRLEIDEFREVGGIAVLVAVVQMLVTGAVTFAIMRLTAFELTGALYISIATVFSSTALVVKVIEEKGDEATLYSRIDLGVLLVQDLVVVLVLAGLASFGGTGGNGGLITQVGSTMVYGLGLVVLSLGVARYILPRLFKVFATSQDAFFVASIAWCLGLVIVAEEFGLSLEIGSFLAGLSLGQLRYNEELKERVRPLTDVFLAFFFASLGLRIDLVGLGGLVFLALALSLTVMVVKFLTITATLQLAGYPERTSFLSGTSLAQISEFSFVLMAVGVGLGHIGDQVVGLVTLVGMLTIGTSSYLMAYSDRIVQFFDIGRMDTTTETEPARLRDHIVLVGCHVQGHELLDRLEERGEDVLVVDYNPRVVEQLIEGGHNAIYGDIGDLKPRKDVGLHQARLVISTIPNVDDTKLLINKAKEHGVDTVVSAETVDIALDMYNTGADYVIFPDRMSASKISQIIGEGLSDPEYLEELQDEHRRMLEEEKQHNGIWYEVFDR